MQMPVPLSRADQGKSISRADVDKFVIILSILALSSDWRRDSNIIPRHFHSCFIAGEKRNIIIRAHQVDGKGFEVDGWALGGLPVGGRRERGRLAG
jgi:hypothetical protein